MTQTKTYKNPSLAVDLIVFGYYEGELSVLLLNRKERPFKNEWTLPGGFVHITDTFHDTCLRILQTKLGINEVYLEQLYSFDEPGRDPRARVISVAYYALINPTKFQIAAGVMANDVKWFPVNKIPRLGFDHADIFNVALARLQSKIQYHPAGFELLDELFTMSELHRLYEVITGLTIDRRNFARKILAAEYVINTGTKREGSQNRHPELFRFNKKIKPNQFHINL